MRQALRLCGWLAVSGIGAVWAGDAPRTFPVGEFQFTRPANWEWVEGAGGMRKAQLKVPGEAGQPAGEVVFFHFGPGGAGGTQANVERWLGQFQEPREKVNPKVEEAAVNRHKVTYVQAQGTYLSGMPGGPKTAQPNTALLGAIVESSQGNVFIKMTGPVALVDRTQEPFKQMVAGALK